MNNLTPQHPNKTLNDFLNIVLKSDVNVKRRIVVMEKFLKSFKERINNPNLYIQENG